MAEGGAWPEKISAFIWEFWLNRGCEKETTPLLFMSLRVTSIPLKPWLLGRVPTLQLCGDGLARACLPHRLAHRL